jgi:hypothetical protein
MPVEYAASRCSAHKKMGSHFGFEILEELRSVHTGLEGSSMDWRCPVGAGGWNPLAGPCGGHGGLGSGAWPLSAGVGPVTVDLRAAGVARSFCSVVVKGWSLTELDDDCQLIATELVTNVLQAADEDQESRLWLGLMSDHRYLRVECWDNVPLTRGVPMRRAARSDDECGRGLDLVDALSVDWGWDHLPKWDAKRVWALMPGKVPVRTCMCGFATDSLEELGDHLGEMFLTASDDVAADGVLHAEVDGSRCACGLVVASFAELDEHLFAAFIPGDGIGADGRKHGAC